ncbi:MAG TPA: DUF6527 family protein [Candidatus Acidoferrales bacterium]|nr:DUF6527 family protein [Candidatus Acidoferrales bacterium]
MKPEIILKHQFVEFIPEDLEQGTIYISIRFATSSHLCVCGCGNKVVAPIRPTDWKLIFDGKTVSLDPSIGNWSFPCQSHYWIRNNRIKWAPKWSREQIERGRDFDHNAKERYFEVEAESTDTVTAVSQPESNNRKRSWWRFWAK